MSESMHQDFDFHRRAVDLAVNTNLSTERKQVMKNITIIRGAGGPHHDLVIRPGTTSREVLQQIGLGDDYVLRSGNNPEPFGADEVVYDQLGDGAKLVATTPVTVGV
jgi:hypothetical protein